MEGRREREQEVGCIYTIGLSSFLMGVRSDVLDFPLFFFAFGILHEPGTYVLTTYLRSDL